MLAAQQTDAAAKVLYHNMVHKPTATNPNNFELEVAHKMYWQVQPTTVPKVEPPHAGVTKISHEHAGGLLPARAWQMDQEGSTAWHTRLAFVVRYNKQRHGLVPVRPHVILCNEITLKSRMYTMLIGKDDSDAWLACSCQQEVEAAHPAPARGRWTRNAGRKWKLPIQRQLGGGGS